MPKGMGMDQGEEDKHQLKLSKYINEMDAEIKDRFKALKSIQDLLQQADEEEQVEIRKLELEFELKYKEIYSIREKIINGKQDLPTDLLAAFEERAKEVQDDDYEKVEITPCDVKSI